MQMVNAVTPIEAYGLLLSLVHFFDEVGRSIQTALTDVVLPWIEADLEAARHQAADACLSDPGLYLQAAQILRLCRARQRKDAA